jgi:hypothetical protein
MRMQGVLQGMVGVVLQKTFQKTIGVIGKLSLTGDMGKPMIKALTKSMLKGPSSTDVTVTLNGYYSLGQKEARKRNYAVAQWYSNHYRTYCRHLHHLRSDPSLEHELKDAKNKVWAALGVESERMFVQMETRKTLGETNLRNASTGLCKGCFQDIYTRC